MRLVVVTALAALLLPSAALAAGPSYVAQGGLGVLSHDGRYRFVAVSTGGGTAIERVAVRGGTVSGWATLDGEWGIPQPTMRPGQLEGLTRKRHATRRWRRRCRSPGEVRRPTNA